MAKFTNLSQNFTMIPNWLINNQDISLKAKGLFIFLASKPDDFDFSADRISKMNKEGVSAINTCLRELESIGLLTRKKIKNNENKFVGIEYILSDKPIKKEVEETPVIESPLIEFPVNGFSTDGKPTNNNNKDYNKKDILLSEIKISDELATEYFVIANAFRNLFIKNSKEQGLVNLKDLENAKYHKWTNEVRLMIENDKVNIDILRDIHDFLSSYTEQAIFWKPNVRSISKLRLQVNNLIVAMNKDKAKQKAIKKQNTFTA